MPAGGRDLIAATARLPTIDIVIAACAIAACVAAIPTVSPRGPLGLAVATNVVSAGVLAWRRIAPEVTTVVSLVALATEAVIVGSLDNTIAQFVLLLFLMFSFGLFTSGGRGAVATGVVALVCGYVVQFHDPNSTAADKIFSAPVLLALPTGAGYLLRRQRRTAARLRTVTLELEARRDTDAHAAVLAERARIAREVHDVVAHSVSVMLVQAGAAEAMLGADATASRTALASVREVGHEALVELRNLLQLLGTESPDARATPQPGLAQLERLVSQASVSGLDVGLHVRAADSVESLPAGVELAAYRLVQEALTNVRKHAGARTARVTVQHDATGLTVEVVDDGRARGGSAASMVSPTGRGLIGMRERVALYRGTFSAGPSVDGGWQVLATLPRDES